MENLKEESLILPKISALILETVNNPHKWEKLQKVLVQPYQSYKLSEQHSQIYEGSSSRVNKDFKAAILKSVLNPQKTCYEKVENVFPLKCQNLTVTPQEKQDNLKEKPKESENKLGKENADTLSCFDKLTVEFIPELGSPSKLATQNNLVVSKVHKKNINNVHKTTKLNDKRPFHKKKSNFLKSESKQEKVKQCNNKSQFPKNSVNLNSPQDSIRKSQLSEKNDNICSKSKIVSELKCEKSPLTEKIIELEAEIKIYHEINLGLKGKCNKNVENLKKLRKEYNKIELFKEEQKKNLKNEIEFEMQKLKKRKDSFHLYQKLQKVNFGKKEQEELITLKKEVEVLQEEQKQLRIKFANDNRKLNNQLIEVEKEKDFLTLQNINLKQRHKDLLSVIEGEDS